MFVYPRSQRASKWSFGSPKMDLWEFWIPSYPWISRGKIRKVESEYCVFRLFDFYSQILSEVKDSRGETWLCFGHAAPGRWTGVATPANAGGDDAHGDFTDFTAPSHSNLRVMEYGGFLQWGCPEFLIFFLNHPKFLSILVLKAMVG